MKPSWQDRFVERLLNEGIATTVLSSAGLEPAGALAVAAEDWGQLGNLAKLWGCRYAATWAEDRDTALLIHALFERDGHYLAARTRVTKATPILPSHTPAFPAANRMERHLQDLYGVAFADHPDPRRWIRHQAWGDSDYPLRRDFPAAGYARAPTPPDNQYRFVSAHGAGAHEIPVGPVHAGIIEPGHFRFQAVGETVLHLEERLGYVHKGIEKIAEGRDASGLCRLAGRVSGDSTVAHAWAACMALERAAGIAPPPRAAFLRAIMAERERVANHLGDIAGICNDVSFAFAFYQFGRLRETWQRASQRAFGHRFMMDRIVPGGVAADLDRAEIERMPVETRKLRSEVESLLSIQNESPTLEDRLATTGYLSPETAQALGTLGYVGRASGRDFDLRRDAPYAPYDRLSVPVPVYHYGDVAARLRVRAEELLASCDLIERLLAELPVGPLQTAWRDPAADAEGLGLVEGWRGEIVAYVRFGENGRIRRYFPRDPSVLNWPALEHLIHDNIVPDFPVCNKSVNGSYSGSDL